MYNLYMLLTYLCSILLIYVSYIGKILREGCGWGENNWRALVMYNQRLYKAMLQSYLNVGKDKT
jgi:hypothetical protein